MRLARRAFLASVALAAMPGALAAQPAAQRSPARIRVVATVAMLADAVRAVGGDRVEVATLMGAGVDPNLYRPTRDDIARLNRADMAFAVGLNLEGQMGGTFRQLARTKPVIFAGERIAAARLLNDDEEPTKRDPHVWMDPSLWSSVVTHVRDTFTVREPANAEVFAANHDRYVAELARLDAYAKRAFGSVPRERRLLVTAHDAFSYMARAYEIEVMGVQGLSTESEAGLRRVEEVVATVVSRRVPAIFVESSVGDRNIRAVIEGAQRRGHTVRIGGELFSDAMGRPNTYEGTYIGMIDHNITTITRALGGEAPARGMDGRLAAA